MMHKMYAVFDSKAAFFSKPFYDTSEGSAIRNFSDGVNDSSTPNNMWNKHSEDYSLFQIGEYEDTTGELIACLPKSIVTASALKHVATHLGTPQDDLPLFNRKNKNSEELVQ